MPKHKRTNSTTQRSASNRIRIKQQTEPGRKHGQRRAVAQMPQYLDPCLSITPCLNILNLCEHFKHPAYGVEDVLRGQRGPRAPPGAPGRWAGVLARRMETWRGHTILLLLLIIIVCIYIYIYNNNHTFLYNVIIIHKCIYLSDRRPRQADGDLARPYCNYLLL